MVRLLFFSICATAAAAAATTDTLFCRCRWQRRKCSWPVSSTRSNDEASFVVVALTFVFFMVFFLSKINIEEPRSDHLVLWNRASKHRKSAADRLFYLTCLLADKIKVLQVISSSFNKDARTGSARAATKTVFFFVVVVVVLFAKNRFPTNDN